MDTSILPVETASGKKSRRLSGQLLQVSNFRETAHAARYHGFFRQRCSSLVPHGDESPRFQLLE